MSSRLAGRALTGPLAFLVAGIADVLLYALGTLRRRRGSARGANPTAHPRRRGSAS